MITSCQPSRPHAHASGIAATTAASGTPTKTPTRTGWNVEDAPSSTSDRTVRAWVLVAPPSVPAVGDEAGLVVLAAGAVGEVVTSAASIISGEVVIVLLWMR